MDTYTIKRTMELIYWWGGPINRVRIRPARPSWTVEGVSKLKPRYTHQENFNVFKQLQRINLQNFVLHVGNTRTSVRRNSKRYFGAIAQS